MELHAQEGGNVSDCTVLLVYNEAVFDVRPKPLPVQPSQSVGVLSIRAHPHANHA